MLQHVEISKNNLIITNNKKGVEKLLRIFHLLNLSDAIQIDLIWQDMNKPNTITFNNVAMQQEINDWLKTLQPANITAEQITLAFQKWRRKDSQSIEKAFSAFQENKIYRCLSLFTAKHHSYMSVYIKQKCIFTYHHRLKKLTRGHQFKTPKRTQAIMSFIRLLEYGEIKSIHQDINTLPFHRTKSNLQHDIGNIDTVHQAF